MSGEGREAAGERIDVDDLPCIACGGNVAPWLDMPIDAKKDLPTRYGAVVRCTQCDLGAVRPLPAPAEIAEFYRLDQYYTHGAGHIEDIAPTLRDRALIHAAWRFDRGAGLDVAEIARTLPRGASVCDLGCGDAGLLRQFAALGFDVVGVDPDPDARIAAAEAGVAVFEGTGEDLPVVLAGRRFDLLIMTHSLEHCRDPAAALANAFALTKAGGSFYCETPNSQCVHFRMFTICSEMFDVPRHLYFFTPRCLRRMIEAAGFEHRADRYSGFTRQHLPGWRAWESTIHDRVRRHAAGTRPGTRSATPPITQTVRHDFMRSVRLLVGSALRPAADKYDSVGILARRPT